MTESEAMSGDANILGQMRLATLPVTLGQVMSLSLALSSFNLACDNAKPPASSVASSVIRSAHVPPSSKDIIVAAFQSASVPLTVHETCRNVGTESTDSTLGQYLSGFVDGLNPDSGTNGVVTSTEETADGWVCRMMIQRRAGPEVWSWGVEFQFDRTGLLKPASYRCIGAG